jgi:hypothetical protein
MRGSSSLSHYQSTMFKSEMVKVLIAVAIPCITAWAVIPPTMEQLRIMAERECRELPASQMTLRCDNLLAPRSEFVQYRMTSTGYKQVF